MLFLKKRLKQHCKNLCFGPTLCPKMYKLRGCWRKTIKKHCKHFFEACSISLQRTEPKNLRCGRPPTRSGVNYMICQHACIIPYNGPTIRLQSFFLSQTNPKKCFKPSQQFNHQQHPGPLLSGGLVGGRPALVALPLQAEGDGRPIRLLGLQPPQATQVDEGIGHGVRLVA